MIRFFALFTVLIAAAHAGDLRLPTENHHLFTGEDERFYMYVDRNFEGTLSKPWEGGAYGFVRTPLRVEGQVLLTKFHEGIDIAPIKRDSAGNPLDLVTSVADGQVVHVSALAGRSNYGKYVVVAHQWENSHVMSLYAHLAEITVHPGDTVKAGSVLGRMGFTGAGINRTRAHVHLEIGYLMSDRYQDWHVFTGKGVNYHGNYNGMNIAGADVAGFFLARKKNPELTFSQFIASTPAYFTVTVPAQGGAPDFLKRYPWLRKGTASDPVSWEISFSNTGLPLAFTPSSKSVPAAVVTAVRPSAFPHRYMTRGLITGEENRATLTAGGKQLVSLLTNDFPVAPTAAAR
ncbi:MAG: M23 family metallopeptidase [Verrucomicrobiota bacterium]